MTEEKRVKKLLTSPGKTPVSILYEDSNIVLMAEGDLDDEYHCATNLDGDFIHPIRYRIYRKNADTDYRGYNQCTLRVSTNHYTVDIKQTKIDYKYKGYWLDLLHVHPLQEHYVKEPKELSDKIGEIREVEWRREKRKADEKKSIEASEKRLLEIKKQPVVKPVVKRSKKKPDKPDELKFDKNGKRILIPRNPNWRLR